jgi:hypothetical protein
MFILRKHDIIKFSYFPIYTALRNGFYYKQSCSYDGQ